MLFFLFYLICARVERVTELAHTPTRSAQGSLSGTSYSTVSLISIAMQVFFPSPVDPQGPKEEGKKKKKRALWFMYTFYLCWSSEGEPGLLSQQRTTHHFLLSSLLLGLITESKHSGSVILLVSQGRLLIQFSPQHCTMVWFSDGGGGEEKKKRSVFL